jgi:hypothetical protein
VIASERTWSNDVTAVAAEFLFHEAELLDGRRLEQWLELFDDPCLYWLPADVDDPSPWSNPSLIYDERTRLGERVRRTLSGASHCQNPPSKLHHLIGNVRAREIGGVDAAEAFGYPERLVQSLNDRESLVLVSSKQIISDVHWGRRSVYAATCTHLLADLGHGSPRIVVKRVDLLEAGEPIFDLTFLL